MGIEGLIRGPMGGAPVADAACTLMNPRWGVGHPTFQETTWIVIVSMAVKHGSPVKRTMRTGLSIHGIVVHIPVDGEDTDPACSTLCRCFNDFFNHSFITRGFLYLLDKSAHKFFCVQGRFELAAVWS